MKIKSLITVFFISFLLLGCFSYQKVSTDEYQEPVIKETPLVAMHDDQQRIEDILSRSSATTSESWVGFRGIRYEVSTGPSCYHHGLQKKCRGVEVYIGEILQEFSMACEDDGYWEFHQ